MVQSCWTRVSEEDLPCLPPTTPGLSVRASPRIPVPLRTKWAVLALMVGLGSQAGRTWAAPHQRGRCTPCNSTVEVASSDLPAVGFICPEGFPDAPLRHPYTCLVFFRDPHNLTIHLHHFHPDHMSVVLCSTMYYDSWPALGGEEDRLCVSLQQLARFRDVDHPVYLNISTLPGDPYSHALPLLGGRGFNLTYEMRRWGDAEPVVGGLDHAHLGDCSYNGVPVLHQLSDRKFRYRCQCAAGVRGDHCQVGGLCASSRDSRSWCTYHGRCRFIAGESICACAEGYYGATCQYHFTTIPSYDETCGGLRHCHHNCHLRVEAQARHAFCSCTAGYLPANTTHCVAQEDWDVSIRMLLLGRREHLTHDHLLHQTLRVVAAVSNGSAVARNTSVTTRSGGKEVVVEVSVEGTALARLLTQTTPWREEFGADEVVASRLPQLSVGPVWAESGSGAALVLSCPVYGGPQLQVTWYKDHTIIYKHNVSYCSYEGQTPRLHVVAERGTSDHECTVMVWVHRPQQEDRGTYVCQVVDRGYQATQMVVAGVNQSLQLQLTPRVLTINQGDNVTLDCVTRNRGWADYDHYSTSWLLQPRRVYSLSPIPRRGSRIYIYNVTESLKVTCGMKEKEGVVWTPQDVQEEEAYTSAAVRVLAPGSSSSIPPTCPDDVANGVTWRRTPAGEQDEASCPEGYRGGSATRYCRGQHLAPPRSAPAWDIPDPPRPAPCAWDIPDFSNCIYEPLVYIKTPLYLYQRGYNSLPEDLESLAKELLSLLQERVPPLLPGEGSSVMDILEMLEQTERTVSLPVVLGILQTLLGKRHALTSTDTWKMLHLTRKYLRASLESPSSEGVNVSLPNIAAELQPLDPARRPTLTMANDPETPADDHRDSLSLLEVTVEVQCAENLQTEELSMEELQTEGLQQEEVEVVVVGVVTFTHLNLHLPGPRSEGGEEPLWVGAPLVQVSAVGHHHAQTPPTHGSSGRHDTAAHTHGSSGRHDTAAHTTHTQGSSAPVIISRLVYSTCPRRRHEFGNRSEEEPWVAACGRVAMVGGGAPLGWELDPCSIVEEADEGQDVGGGTAEGGRCECQCRGPGLYSLVLVPPSTPKVPQEEAWRWTGNVAVVASCVASVAVVVLCVLLQLPRASLTTVQLQILKCLSLSGLNVTFAVFALWPTSQEVHEGVLVAGSSCLMLCVGVGVSQQVALHQQLGLAPNTTPISPTHLTTLMVLLLSVLVGLMVGLVQRLQHYSLGPPWLPLGVAWGLTAAVLSSLAAVSLLWAALTGHNLRRLAFIKASTPSHKNLSLVEGRVRQMVVVMGGEWALIFSSLFQHHPVGRYLFCLATLTQSVVTVVVYTCGGEDLGSSCRWCPCLPREPRPPPPAAEDGDEFVLDVGEVKGCMGGLMTCRIPSTRTYEVIPARGSRRDALGFRARGGSLWSQTTTTVVMSEGGDLLHSPRDPIRPAHRHLPDPRSRLALYARCSSFGAGDTGGVKRPRNLFLRGTDLVCGEDMTSLQENVLSVSSLTYEDMDPRVSRTKRNLSFSVHRPVVHEFQAEWKLDGLLKPQTQHDGPLGQHDAPLGQYDGPLRPHTQHDGPLGQHDAPLRPHTQHDGPLRQHDAPLRSHTQNDASLRPHTQHDGPLGQHEGPLRPHTQHSDENHNPTNKYLDMSVRSKVCVNSDNLRRPVRSKSDARSIRSYVNVGEDQSRSAVLPNGRAFPRASKTRPRYANAGAASDSDKRSRSPPDHHRYLPMEVKRKTLLKQNNKNIGKINVNSTLGKTTDVSDGRRDSGRDGDLIGGKTEPDVEVQTHGETRRPSSPHSPANNVDQETHLTPETQLHHPGRCRRSQCHSDGRSTAADGRCRRNQCQSDGRSTAADGRCRRSQCQSDGRSTTADGRCRRSQCHSDGRSTTADGYREGRSAATEGDITPAPPGAAPGAGEDGARRTL